MAVTNRTGLTKLTAANDALGRSARVFLIRISSGATGGAVVITDGSETIWAPTIGANAELLQVFYGARLADV